MPRGPRLRMIRWPKGESVVDIRDMGLGHIQRQPQGTLQECPAFLTNSLSMMFIPLDDDHKVIGIAAVGDGWFPLAILTNRNGPTVLDAAVPRPAILSGLLAQVVRVQVRIKLMEHDVGEER